jgi:hypothetical protein
MPLLRKIVDDLRPAGVCRARSHRARVAERDHANVRQLGGINEFQLIAFKLEDRHFIIVHAEAARQFGRNPDGIRGVQALALTLLSQLIE